MNLLIFHSLFFISLYRGVMRWLLVVDTMVRRRAFSGQGQKCIPMCKSPLDDLFHGIDTEAFDIMLQDNGDIMLLNPGDEVAYVEPSFVSYLPCVVMADGVPVPSQNTDIPYP